MDAGLVSVVCRTCTMSSVGWGLGGGGGRLLWTFIPALEYCNDCLSWGFSNLVKFEQSHSEQR